MRFGLNLLALRPGKVGGTETYVRQLVRHLPSVAESEELILVVARDVVPAIEAPGFRIVVVDLGERALVMARIAEAFTPYRAQGIERVIGELRLDAMLFPQQSIFPKCAPVAAAVTIHDMQHLFHPENFALFDRVFRAAAYSRSLTRAGRVIAISEWTKKTLVDRAGVPASKIGVVPFGAFRKGRADPGPPDSLPGPYLYYPAATFPHKNHATLFRSYAALRRRGALTEPLVLTGVRTRLWGALERLIRELDLEQHIRHLGYLPYDEVLRVYAGASAVLFPSLFEGFGLPVVEAAVMGKKTIVSRLEVFDEIGVPRRYQIDFADPEQLLAALRLEGPTLLERAPSSWEDMARATLRELHRTAREQRGAV